MEIIITGLILVIGWIGIEIIFYIKHKRPLTEAEIQSLANKRKHKYVKQKYNFQLRLVSVNQVFKSSLNPKGQLYHINENLENFPSLVGALLKGKKHEWTLKAVVKEERIICFYTNKGHDNQSVYCFLSIDELITMCKKEGGCTILAFHNHPNSNPNLYNCLLASKQDLISANYYGNEFSNAGINYLAFVCERGRFLRYYMKISPSYYPQNARIGNIAKENGLSNNRNYHLHRELGLLFRKYENIYGNTE